MERAITRDLVSHILEFSMHLLKGINFAAELDCFLSLALVARQNNYVRPTLTAEAVLDIRNGRKKRRIHDPEVPPKVDEQRHHNAPPSGDDDVVIMIKPQPPPPPFIIISGLSTFTCEELAMATDWFSDGNLLGEGGFGYVHKGILSNGKEVAVKQLNVGSGQGEREFQTEVEILSRVHHKHLVSLIGYCITPRLLLVYDFLPNNTMDFHLHHAGKGMGMEFATRMRIALGSAKGLAYLHEDCYPKIIHRDIKAANILLDFNYEPKVADFGFAKIISDDDAINVSTTRVMGTLGYLAPEYLCSGKLSEKSDVFSFGVMLLELITGRRPNGLVNWARPLLTRALDDGNFDSIVDSRLQRNYNHNEMARMVSIADVCVRHSPRRRPKMSQVVRALEGHDMSLSDLDDDDSSIYNGSSDNDTQEYASSAPTSEYGSVSSSPIHTDGDEL